MATTVGETGETKTVTVRNDRTYYQEGEKPNWQATVDKAIQGYFRKEVTTYAPFGASKPDGTPDKTSTKTKYYDEQGNVMAVVYNVRASKYDHANYNHNTLHTPTADYHDWDMDGTIDSKDVDKTYTVEKPKEPEKQNPQKPSIYDSFPHKLNMFI